MAKAATTKRASSKKATTKKTTAKKSTVRKTPAKKATKRAVKKITEIKVKARADKQTKSEILNVIAEETDIARKDVQAVFKSLARLIEGHMKKRGSGELTVPETGIKVRRHRKPATKAREMVSPFTGEKIKVKAKPARSVVKLSALKALKETVAK